MSRVGVLSRLHDAVGNLATTFVFVSRLSLFRLGAVATFWPMSPVGIYQVIQCKKDLDLVLI